MKNTLRSAPRNILAFLMLALPSLAHAHAGTGTASGWLAAFVHPFSGLDHLCAMVAVGLWAAQMGGRALWRVPLTFVSIMLAGGLLGMAQIHIPFVEQGIVMSLLVLGVLVAAAVRLPVAASAPIVAIFALFHGYAHGAEMPANALAAGYAAGFMLATAMLHGSGMVVALLFKTSGRALWLRWAGAAITLCGSWLLFAG